ncbi:MAG: hypothetical protein EXS36_02850 [Pedosphaera sp.]|nr:hypothetical protein [Pedosphaera sp.]
MSRSPIPLTVIGSKTAAEQANILPLHRFQRLRRIGTLLWSEWFAHSRLFLFFLLCWLAVIWLLPLVAQPLWVVLFPILYALVAAPAFAGADVIHGCEEFMLSMPPTRSERFSSRLLFGGGSLLLFTGMTLAALNLNLSDILNRLFLNTGLIQGLQGLQVRQPRLLYSLVVVFPFTVFASSFSMAALARTRTVAFSAWVWGSLVALGTLRLGLWLEESLWEQLTGAISVPLLVALGFLVLLAAWRLYLRKEAGADASPLRIPLSWWGWLLAVLIAGGLVAALIAWFALNFERIL